MIGAGTLSKRTRSTPPSFNEIEWDGERLTVTVRNLDDAKRCDTAAHAKFFQGMLERGFYLPPSQFECAFISAAHTESDIDAFVSAAQETLVGSVT